MNNNAQTATEYLVLIGIVIIIAVLVISLLGGIPSIGSNSNSQANEIVLSTMKIGISNIVFNSLGASFDVKNNLADRITVSHISIENVNCTFATQMVFNPGKEKRVTCYGPRFTTTQDLSLNLEIGYTDAENGAVYANIVDNGVKLQLAPVGGDKWGTGSTECYSENSGTPIACTSSDATGQDGKIDGSEKSISNIGNNILYDDISGLYWVDNFTVLNVSSAESFCNNLIQGSFSDWRLPNIIEFYTLLDFDKDGVQVYPFSGASSSTNDFWTATEDPNDGSKNFNVENYYSTIYLQSAAATLSKDVTCVRSNPQGITFEDTSKSFSLSGSSIVVDEHTGLIWEQDDNDTTMLWNESLDYCNNLVLGGYSDWRLPTAIEGTMFMDYSETDFTNDLFAAAGSLYWTSTTDDYDDTDAYAFDLSTGITSGNYYPHGKGNSYYVRCVRDFQFIS